MSYIPPQGVPLHRPGHPHKHTEKKHAHTEEDHSNSEVWEDFTGPTPGKDFCVVVEKYIQQFVGYLDPLIQLLQTLGSQEGSQNNDHLAGHMQKLMEEIGKGVSSDAVVQADLSDESKQALHMLTSKVGSFHDDTICNKQLAALIQKWKESKDAKALFEMAQMIRDGRCIGNSPDEMKAMFIKGLESLGRALEEAKSKPHSHDREHIVNGLTDCADKTVCVLKREEQIQQGPLSEQEKTRLRAEQLEDLVDIKDQVDGIVNDPAAQKIIPQTLGMLQEWSETVTNIINDYFSAYDLAKKEEQKEQEEKACEKRHADIAKFKKLKAKRAHHKSLAERAKSNELYVKSQIQKYKEIKEAHRRTRNNQYFYAKGQESKFQAQYTEASSKYAHYEARGQAVSAEKAEVKHGLPSSTVCDDVHPFNLELDLLC